jgi:Zn-dependent protease with chaperone function
MSSSSSLTRRAALALTLMVGFYVLALAVVVGGIWLIAFMYDGFGSLAGWVTFFAVGGIFAIVSDLVPRGRRFEAPGPRLTPQDQPRLFEEIRAIAGAMRRPMPDAVYLTYGPNAGIGSAGGFAGIGSRSYVVVGLPLMAAMTISEFRAVIAHEFGHHVAGDTRLAPIVYRTRERIVSTISNLRGSGWRLMHLPFLWYGRMYMRVTQSVSRRQELAADAIAARIAGAGALATALVKVRSTALAMRGFSSSLIMVVSAGFRPPLAEGFARYLRGTAVAAWLQDSAAAKSAEDTADPYDSHPGLRERLQALAPLTHEADRTPDPPAMLVLEDEANLEIALLSRLFGSNVRSSPSIRWDEVLPLRLLAWEKRCAGQRAALSGLRPADLPKVVAEVQRFAARIEGETSDRRREEAFKLRVAEALTLALVRRAWTVDAGLGDIVTARSSTFELKPFTVLSELQSGALPPAAWERTCREAGIAELDLADAALGRTPD